MKNPITICILFIFIIALSSTSNYAQQKPAASKTLKSSGYAPVNGLKMYYEIHGDGKPLVLLHGSYMTIDLNFAQLIPELAKKRKVIALEMQGHGRTGDINRPYSYTSLASDIDGLLNHLKIDSADVLGYSLGGTVAFELAIKHPKRITSLVIISSVFRLDGWIQSARDLFPTIKPEFFEKTPLKTEYDRLAPDKAHWNDWVNKMVASEVVPFDLGADNIKALKCPVLIISGDNDGVDLNHVAEMYRLCGGGVFGDITGLPKSRLAILPGMTHVTLMMETAKLMSIIDPFLK
jgi:pimeloyl-ACP methyl ester carboxylesterase